MTKTKTIPIGTVVIISKDYKPLQEKYIVTGRSGSKTKIDRLTLTKVKASKGLGKIELWFYEPVTPLSAPDTTTPPAPSK